jgi:hypothetical protein
VVIVVTVRSVVMGSVVTVVTVRQLVTVVLVVTWQCGQCQW